MQTRLTHTRGHRKTNTKYKTKRTNGHVRQIETTEYSVQSKSIWGALSLWVHTSWVKIKIWANKERKKVQHIGRDNCVLSSSPKNKQNLLIIRNINKFQINIKLKQEECVRFIGENILAPSVLTVACPPQNSCCRSHLNENCLVPVSSHSPPQYPSVCSFSRPAGSPRSLSLLSWLSKLKYSNAKAKQERIKERKITNISNSKFI